LTRKVLSSEVWVSLIEVIIGVALLGSIGLASVTALSSGVFTGVRVDEGTTATNLARSQLENVKLQSYALSAEGYTKVSAPEGYAIELQVEPVAGVDINLLQRIKVSVAARGETLVQISGYNYNPSPPSP